MEDQYVTEAEFKALKSSLGGFADRIDGVTDLLKSLRQPSKAEAIYGGEGKAQADDSGRFLTGIMKARSSDASEQFVGKAILEELATRYQAWEDLAPHVKATIGDTDAAGGWVIPNAVVDDFTKPRSFANIYRNLVTVRTGVQTAAVDIPWRSAAPTRAVVAGFGTTKDNQNLVYNGYAATMYTLARIYDIGLQFARQSAGAAEKDVLEELATAMGRGEAYYIREGSGSSEPFGYTSALTNGPSTFRSTFTPSATTLAGSIVVSIGTAAAALLARGRKPEAAVISPTIAAYLLTQGTDTAGLFLNGATGGMLRPDFGPATPLVTPFGIPVIVDPDADGTAAVADNMVVGEWSALKMYTGAEYRVDTSTQAGNRWDTNLVGFRGEEEMGFDARPAVYAGALQMITDVTP